MLRGSLEAILVLTHHTGNLGTEPDCWGHLASFRPYCVLFSVIGPVCAMAPLCVRCEEGKIGTLTKHLQTYYY